MSKPHTVIVILEAKSGSEAKLKEALELVAQPSRQESTCLMYRVHQSKQNPAEFVLYEQWESAEKHALQFSKAYIKEFAEIATPLLAKPYQVFFAEEL